MRMSNVSEQHNLCVESADFLSMPSTGSTDTAESITELPSLSCGDITKSSLKHPSNVLHREDSISSKGSSNSLFPTFMKSFDSSTFSLNQDFVPRPEKALVLFDIVLSTLKDLKKKYSALTHPTVHSPGQVQGEMSKKVENRISLIQSLRDEYKSTLEEKEAELNKIKATIKSVILSKNGKEEIETLDCENYWSLCRDMCIIELKLEKCCGKLQFQIMELDFVSRVNLLDQYELSIKLNEVSKFKTKIKIEKKGHQVWDNTTFVLTPSVEDCLDVKFCELKTLNKQLVLLEKKVMFVNNLILSDPSIFTFWLTPVGSIKLKVIVQWNAILEDLELGKTLNQIQNKFPESDVIIRKRMNSSALKYSQNRLSVNFGHFFKSQGVDKTSPFGSMENIAEQIDEGKVENINIRGVAIERGSNKIKGRYHEDFLSENIKSEKTKSGQDQAPPKLINDTKFTNNESAVKVSLEEVKMRDTNVKSEERKIKDEEIIHSDYTKPELKYSELSKGEDENRAEEAVYLSESHNKMNTDKEYLTEENKMNNEASFEQNVTFCSFVTKEDDKCHNTNSEHINNEEEEEEEEEDVFGDLVMKSEILKDNQDFTEIHSGTRMSDSRHDTPGKDEESLLFSQVEQIIGEEKETESECRERRDSGDACVEDSSMLGGSRDILEGGAVLREGAETHSYSIDTALDHHSQDIDTVGQSACDCAQSDLQNTKGDTDTEKNLCVTNSLQDDTTELCTSSLF